MRGVPATAGVFTVILSDSASNTGWLHRQGSVNDSGTSPLRYPDGRRDGAVRQGGQGLQQDALQAPEEKRGEKVV